VLYANPRPEEKTPESQNCRCLQDELGRVPKEEEINQVFLLTRVMYKAIIDSLVESPL
jgi:hypothetical protein